jgi:galactose mutarotase-like enzyme
MYVTISNSKLSAQIYCKGAELFSLKSLDNNQEYMWEGNPKFWEKHSPILFPIVGTLKNNSYTYNDKHFQLLRHGLARNLNFSLIHATDNQAIFTLQSSEETKQVYPFEFELQITYTLLDSKLELNYTIINNDKVAMPFSIGAHPAFALPNNFESYSLEFNQQETLNCFTLENDLVSDNSFEIALENKRLPLDYSIFENDALIFKTLQSRAITILENNKPLLKVAFNDFKNLGIWTKVGASFICIEPWLGYSDAVHATGNLLEKEGIQLVAVNERFECGFSVEIL